MNHVRVVTQRGDMPRAVQRRAAACFALRKHRAVRRVSDRVAQSDRRAARSRAHVRESASQRSRKVLPTDRNDPAGHACRDAKRRWKSVAPRSASSRLPVVRRQSASSIAAHDSSASAPSGRSRSRSSGRRSRRTGRSKSTLGAFGWFGGQKVSGITLFDDQKAAVAHLNVETGASLLALARGNYDLKQTTVTGDFDVRIDPGHRTRQRPARPRPGQASPRRLRPDDPRSPNPTAEPKPKAEPAKTAAPLEDSPTSKAPSTSR